MGLISLGVAGFVAIYLKRLSRVWRESCQSQGRANSRCWVLLRSRASNYTKCCNDLLTVTAQQLGPSYRRGNNSAIEEILEICVQLRRGGQFPIVGRSLHHIGPRGKFQAETSALNTHQGNYAPFVASVSIEYFKYSMRDMNIADRSPTCCHVLGQHNYQ